MHVQGVCASARHIHAWDRRGKGINTRSSYWLRWRVTTMHAQEPIQRRESGGGA